MTKSEVCWLIVRTFGLVASIFAAKQILSVVYLAYLFGSGALRNMKSELGARVAFDTAWPSAFGCLILALAAYYLLRRGQKVHDLLMYENGNCA